VDHLLHFEASHMEQFMAFFSKIDVKFAFSEWKVFGPIHVPNPSLLHLTSASILVRGHYL